MDSGTGNMQLLFAFTFQIPQRERWICAFEEDLRWIEEQRFKRAEEEMKKLALTLLDIGYLLPDQIATALQVRYAN